MASPPRGFFFPTHAHFAPLFTANRMRYWPANAFTMTVAGGSDPEAILATAEMPYSSCTQAGTSENGYTVSLRGFADYSVQYANRLVEQRLVEWAQPSDIHYAPDV